LLGQTQQPATTTQTLTKVQVDIVAHFSPFQYRASQRGTVG